MSGDVALVDSGEGAISRLVRTASTLFASPDSRWALESGTALRVVVLDEAAAVVESGSLTVATTPALVACKLHAISDRRGSASTKQESDALDLFRLVSDLIRSDADVDALRDAPFDLPVLVADQIGRWFIDESLRTARLASAGTAGSDRVDPADIATIGHLLVDHLSA